MNEQFLTMAWVRRHAHKMDPAVRGCFVDACRPVSRTPSVLKSGVSKWVSRRRVPVLIEIESACTHLDRTAVERHLHRGKCGRVRNLGLVHAVTGEVPLRLLAGVVQDARVRRVMLDREVNALLDVTAPTVQGPRMWDAQMSGKGVTVAVIDTGVDPHPDFTEPVNRILAFKDLVNEKKRGKNREPYDDNGHGTHVSGIVAGNGTASEGTYKGIAPGAALVGVKVLNAHGSGRISTIIEGIEWCVTNRDRYGIRVLNLSLGGPAQRSWDEDPLALAVGAAWEKGLTVCVAAGNDGPNPNTIGSPAIHPRVITVGASDDRGTVDPAGNVIAPFSSRGPAPGGIEKPDLVAPGKEVTAPMAPHSVTAIGAGKKGALYLPLSGTSMATPVVSGMVALLIESVESDSKQDGKARKGKRPRDGQELVSLSPDQVKDLLTRSARNLGAKRAAQGAGLADVWAAAEVLAKPRQAPRASAR